MTQGHAIAFLTGLGFAMLFLVINITAYTEVINDLREDFRHILSSAECDGLFEYLEQNPNREFVKGFFVNNCIWEDEFVTYT